MVTQSANAETTKVERSEAAELAAIEGAKISLADAIAAAEKEFGGKAVEAGIEDENGALAYEIELLGPNGEQKVAVDTQTGKATEMAADAEEGDDDEGGENEDAD